MRFTAPPGGVLVEGDRVVRGELVASRTPDGVVTVRPADGPQEWYVVADGPATPEMTLDVVVARLARHPGEDDSGRAMPTSLAARPDEDDGYLDDVPEPIGDQLF